MPGRRSPVVKVCRKVTFIPLVLSPGNLSGTRGARVNQLILAVRLVGEDVSMDEEFRT